MGDKKRRLAERATATVRVPQPNRLRETDTTKTGYRVVAVSLYTPEPCLGLVDLLEVVSLIKGDDFDAWHILLTKVDSRRP